MRIERVTVTDAVISCEAEKVGRYVNQKWVYDVRAKKLLGQLSYHPSQCTAFFRTAPAPYFSAAIGQDWSRSALRPGGTRNFEY